MHATTSQAHTCMHNTHTPSCNISGSLLVNWSVARQICSKSKQLCASEHRNFAQSDRFKKLIYLKEKKTIEEIIAVAFFKLDWI